MVVGFLLLLVENHKQLCNQIVLNIQNQYQRTMHCVACGIKMYQTYAKFLEQKYGHKQEFFTPATISVTKQNAQGKDYTVQESAPLGNPDFLQQLQSGAATLYSTYYNQEVGAALAVNVDGNGKSYIVIDYKNLPILQAREKETIDAL